MLFPSSASLLLAIILPQNSNAACGAVDKTITEGNSYPKPDDGEEVSCGCCNTPVIEIHISNQKQRENI